MSTADAVSLFTTSLNSALAKQKQDILSELQPEFYSSRYSLTVSQPWRSAILSILLRWRRVSSSELINALVSSNLH
jgi:hypothetical protein